MKMVLEITDEIPAALACGPGYPARVAVEGLVARRFMRLKVAR